MSVNVLEKIDIKTSVRESIHPLTTSCLATLAYFDVFQYPLTLLEVRRHLYVLEQGAMLGAVTAAMVREALRDSRVGHRDGLYFLKGRESLVALRHERHRIAQKKLQRARLFARIVQMLPAVRYIAVCNNLAFCNATRDSDIDLFVIVKSGTIWTTRFLVTSALTLLRLRPTPTQTRDRLCASFWVTTSALDLSSLRLPGGDPYLLYWIATLVPLYDDGVGEDFAQENQWVSQTLPFALRGAVEKKVFAQVDESVNPYVSRIESWLRTLQKRLFPEVIRRMVNRDTRVRVNDAMLKFHTNDRRAQYAAQFERRLRMLGIG